MGGVCAQRREDYLSFPFWLFAGQERLLFLPKCICSVASLQFGPFDFAQGRLSGSAVGDRFPLTPGSRRGAIMFRASSAPSHRFARVEGKTTRSLN